MLRKPIERRQTEGHNQYEFYLPQANGNRLPVLVTARQIEDPDGNIFAVITATDITEQKRAENALRKANEDLEKRHQEIEEDLLLAARVQQSLAPTGLTWGGVNVATYYQPVRTIGGDFGLVAPRQDSLSLFVCDVSGHGIGSALVANRIYTETMSQIERGVALGPMMHHLNRFVLRNIGSSVFYFTMVAARLDRDNRTLEFANAGHPPAMIAHPGQAPRLLESGSAVLGLLEDAVGDAATVIVPVQSGDRLVIYTDGFTESFNQQRDMLGVEGLSEIVRRNFLPAAAGNESNKFSTALPPIATAHRTTICLSSSSKSHSTGCEKGDLHLVKQRKQQNAASKWLAVFIAPLRPYHEPLPPGTSF